MRSVLLGIFIFSAVSALGAIAINVVAAANGRWNLLIGQSLLIVPAVTLICWSSYKNNDY